MRGKRYSEEQILGILREHEAGGTAKDQCRRQGIAEQAFYRWRSKYGGLELSELRRLKAVEAENRKLKQLLAEQVLDSQTLKVMLETVITSEAVGSAGVRPRGYRGTLHQRATHLPGGGLVAFDLSLPEPQSRGWPTS